MIEITQEQLDQAQLARLEKVESQAGKMFDTAITLFGGNKVTEEQLLQLDLIPFRAEFGGEAKDVLTRYEEKKEQYLNRPDIEGLRSKGFEGNLAAIHNPSFWTAYAHSNGLVIKGQTEIPQNPKRSFLAKLTGK